MKVMYVCRDEMKPTYLYTLQCMYFTSLLWLSCMRYHCALFLQQALLVRLSYHGLVHISARILFTAVESMNMQLYLGPVTDCLTWVVSD